VAHNNMMDCCIVNIVSCVHSLLMPCPSHNPCRVPWLLVLKADASLSLPRPLPSQHLVALGICKHAARSYMQIFVNYYAFCRRPACSTRLLFMAVSRGPDNILFPIAEFFSEALEII
jgi:hypothetical protein